MPYPTGNLTHDDNVVAEENTRFQAVATTRAVYGNNPANYATFAAAVKAADIVYHRSCLASAKTTGIQPIPHGRPVGHR
jgi:hypothetical protein